MDHELQDEIYREGLRLLLRSVEADRDAAVAERDELIAACNQRVAGFERKLDAIRNILSGSTTHSIGHGVVQLAPLKVAAQGSSGDRLVSARRWREDIVRRVESLLAGGRQMRASAIYAELLAQGVEFRNLEHPERRIVQILSLAEQFAADRKAGWRLADPKPVPDGASAPPDADQSSTGKEAADSESRQ